MTSQRAKNKRLREKSFASLFARASLHKCFIHERPKRQRLPITERARVGFDELVERLACVPCTALLSFKRARIKPYVVERECQHRRNVEAMLERGYSKA